MTALRNIALLVACIIILLCTQFRHGVGQVYKNLGYLQLSSALVADTLDSNDSLERGESFFIQSISWLSQVQGTYRGLGILYFSLGEDEKAIEALESAQYPPELLIIFGDIALRTRKFDNALTWYKYASIFDFSLGANSYAGLLHRQGRFREAIQIWQTALNSYPNEVDRLEWWRGLLKGYAEISEWATVIQSGTTALAEYPDDPILLTTIGTAIYHYDNDSEVASQYILRAMDIDASLATPYVNMAQISIAEGDDTQAYKWYSEAIRRDPTVRWWHVARANIARDMDNLSLAIEQYRQTIERFPTYSSTYYELAWAYYLNQQVDQAVIAIETAIRMSETYPNVKYFLRAGEIYAAIDDQENALATYRRAAELFPDNRRVRKQLNTLQTE